MMNLSDARQIACGWINAFNDHDLDRVMDFYADDLVFTSPLIVTRMGVDSGTITSKSELRRYFATALGPDSVLIFDLQDVFVGVSSITLLYQNHRNELVAETKILNAEGKAERVYVHHLAAPLT